MSGLLAALTRNPVRTYLYGLVGPAVAVAVGYGLLSKEDAVLWIGLAGAILLPAGAEAARRRVTPTADPRDDDGNELYPQPEPADL